MLMMLEMHSRLPARRFSPDATAPLGLASGLAAWLAGA